MGFVFFLFPLASFLNPTYCPTTINLPTYPLLELSKTRDYCITHLLCLTQHGSLGSNTTCAFLGGHNGPLNHPTPALRYRLSHRRQAVCPRLRLWNPDSLSPRQRQLWSMGISDWIWRWSRGWAVHVSVTP